MKWLRVLWALPNTLLGLLIASTAIHRGHGRVVDGVLEVHGGGVTWLLERAPMVPGGAAAMTLGHVVLGLDAERLERTRAHERAHVRQAEIWGPLFLPAYALGSLFALLWRRDPYLDNPFEVDARSREQLPR